MMGRGYKLRRGYEGVLRLIVPPRLLLHPDDRDLHLGLDEENKVVHVDSIPRY